MKFLIIAVAMEMPVQALDDEDGTSLLTAVMWLSLSCLQDVVGVGIHIGTICLSGLSCLSLSSLTYTVTQLPQQ